MTVVDWLLDSDPSIRWQAMRDLTDESPNVVAAERSRVATEGWGARLLALQAPDGLWGGMAWSQDWTETFHVPSGVYPSTQPVVPEASETWKLMSSFDGSPAAITIVPEAVQEAPATGECGFFATAGPAATARHSASRAMAMWRRRSIRLLGRA